MVGYDRRNQSVRVDTERGSEGRGTSLGFGSLDEGEGDQRRREGIILRVWKLELSHGRESQHLHHGHLLLARGGRDKSSSS